jgi:hypothetical protein
MSLILKSLKMILRVPSQSSMIWSVTFNPVFE